MIKHSLTDPLLYIHHRYSHYIDASLQEATIRLRQDVIVVRLERQPYEESGQQAARKDRDWWWILTAFLRRPYLRIAKSRLFFRDEGLLVPTALRRRIDKQLRMARLVHGHEPEGCCVDRLADLERA